jgi:hypothetical protein
MADLLHTDASAPNEPAPPRRRAAPHVGAGHVSVVGPVLALVAIAMVAAASIIGIGSAKLRVGVPDLGVTIARLRVPVVVAFIASTAVLTGLAVAARRSRRLTWLVYGRRVRHSAFRRALPAALVVTAAAGVFCAHRVPLLADPTARVAPNGSGDSASGTDSAGGSTGIKPGKGTGVGGSGAGGAGSGAGGAGGTGGSGGAGGTGGGTGTGSSSGAGGSGGASGAGGSGGAGGASSGNGGAGTSGTAGAGNGGVGTAGGGGSGTTGGAGGSGGTGGGSGGGAGGSEDPALQQKAVDADHDGIDDAVDPNVDTDGDGINDIEDQSVDADGDGIDDPIDPSVDTNEDGTDDRQPVAIAPVGPGTGPASSAGGDATNDPANPTKGKDGTTATPGSSNSTSDGTPSKKPNEDKKRFGVGPIGKPILFLLSAVMAIVAWRAWRRRKPAADTPVVTPFADEVAETDSRSPIIAAALERTIAAMPDDPDPRRAIIGAYASMLDGFAAAGLPRHPAETPDGYLKRCLDGLRIRPEPASELTHLFGLARFSSHDMTEDHRAAALRSLAAALADVRAGARQPVGATR